MPTPIHNCRRLFRFRCPRQWESLQSTDDEHIRFCLTCNKPVHFCQTEEEIDRHAGQCVAFVADNLLVEMGDIDYPGRKVREMSEDEAGEIMESIEVHGMEPEEPQH